MKPRNLVEQHIPQNVFSNPGIIRRETRALDFHWTEDPGATEDQIASYFRGLENQDPCDDIPDRYAGANYVVGPQKIIEIVPFGNVTYTAAANGQTTFYTPKAKKLFGGQYTRYYPDSLGYYGTRQYALSPNFLTCSIEIVHPDETGEFEPETVTNVILLTAWLLDMFRLDTSACVRHFDITGKKCPRDWVVHPERFKDFKNRVQGIRQLR